MLYEGMLYYGCEIWGYEGNCLINKQQEFKSYRVTALCHYCNTSVHVYRCVGINSY